MKVPLPSAIFVNCTTLTKPLAVCTMLLPPSSPRTKIFPQPVTARDETKTRSTARRRFITSPPSELGVSPVYTCARREHRRESSARIAFEKSIQTLHGKHQLATASFWTRQRTDLSLSDRARLSALGRGQ